MSSQRHRTWLSRSGTIGQPSGFPLTAGMRTGCLNSSLFDMLCQASADMRITHTPGTLLFLYKLVYLFKQRSKPGLLAFLLALHLQQFICQPEDNKS